MGVFRLKMSRPTQAEKVKLGNIGEIQYSPIFCTIGGHFEANPPLANVHSTQNNNHQSCWFTLVTLGAV